MTGYSGFSYPRPPRRRGCVTFLIESPSRFRPNTARLMASPGKNTIHGAVSSAWMPAVSMPPEDGSSGGAPVPMKLSKTSTTMA
jgi:hypothetical protein